MPREKKYMHVSISLDKDYKKKLTYLAEFEHRRLSQQIVHMTEFYLKHQVETRNLLEQYTKHQYELGKHRTSSSSANFIDKKTKTTIENKAPHRIMTSQVLQDNKGFIVSDVPQKKAKRSFESLSS
jgi:predicted transcriptional regulator